VLALGTSLEAVNGAHEVFLMSLFAFIAFGEIATEHRTVKNHRSSLFIK
jgi:hypothetical protein